MLGSLVTGQRKKDLESHYMEAEKIIFYIYAKLREKGELRTVAIDAEDMDVFVLATNVAHEIPGVWGKCMSVPIILEIHFDWASIYSLFYKSNFPQTQYISFFSLLGLKKKKAVFNYKELCSAEMAKVIIPLHVHAGADAASGFFRQGKISVWWKVEKSPQEVISLLNGK